MTWVREANKNGRYETTYLGFRIYVAKEATTKEELCVRDGQQFRTTQFLPGLYVAINSMGQRLEGRNLEDIGGKIDVQDLENYFDHRKK